jgi:hypothetical protein
MRNRKNPASGTPALLILILLVGCGSGGTLLVNSQARSLSRQFGNLEFNLSAPKTLYTRGENVPLTFTIKNISTQTVTAGFGSPFPYDIQVTQGKQVLWEFPPGTVPVVALRLTFAPGETKTFTQAWDQHYSLQGPDAPPGPYQVHAWLRADQIDSASFLPEEAKVQLRANPINITLGQ